MRKRWVRKEVDTQTTSDKIVPRMQNCLIAKLEQPEDPAGAAIHGLHRGVIPWEAPSDDVFKKGCTAGVRGLLSRLRP
jgi:hypothetical protein